MTRGVAIAMALAACVAAIHWPAPGASFAYDDRDFVEANQAIRSLAGGLAGIALPFPPEQRGRALYRPLTHLSYAVDHALFGLSARAFHVTNTLLYALVCVGVFALASAYRISAGFALSVALLWAAHPVHSEAVDAIAGRGDLLALLFGLASIGCWQLRIDSSDLSRAARLGRLSAAAFALACFSKETGAVTLAVLAAHSLAFDPPGRGAGWRGWLSRIRGLSPHLALLAGYVILRLLVLGRFTPEVVLLHDHGPAVRLWTAGAVFAENLRLLLAPLVLQPDFYYQSVIGVVERPGLRAGIGLVAGVALLGVALALTRRQLGGAADGRVSRERAVALCGFAIFFGYLLPTSHLLDIGAVMAERFLLAPSLGFVIVAVLAARRGLRRAPSALVATGVMALVVAGAARSHARAAEWRDSVALWSSAAAIIQGDPRIHANLAVAFIERGEPAAARAEIERALSLDPEHLPSLGNLAALEIESGRLEIAEAVCLQLLALRPDDYIAWYNLGRIAMQRGDPALALERFERALELNPNHAWSRRGIEQARASAQGASR